MPVLVLFFGSLADEIEWAERMEPMMRDSMGYIGWKWIPDYPTLENFGGAFVSGSGIFDAFLEFHKAYSLYSGGTAFGGDSQRVGICRV